MRILYLGLHPPEGVIHCPIIQIVPRLFSIENLSKYSHIIFTSQSAVSIFFSQCNPGKNQLLIAVGKKTKRAIEKLGYRVSLTPQEETAEGLIDALKKYDLQKAFIFWPHSARSRTVLSDFFEENNIAYRDLVIYDTLPLQPNPWPNLELIDEIVFTSPSTVDAFLQFFGSLPKDKRLTPIGPITENSLELAKRSTISYIQTI